MADSVGGDMIRGHIDSIILNSLLDGDKDTNQIRSEIEEKAGGNFKLKQGTFYSALQRISKQGFVTEYRTSGSDGVRRKFFQLTEKGKAHIEKSQSTWSQSQNVINRLLDAEQPVVEQHKNVSTVENIIIPSFEQPKEEITDFALLSSQENQEEQPVTDFMSLSDDDEFSALDFKSDETEAPADKVVDIPEDPVQKSVQNVVAADSETVSDSDIGKLLEVLDEKVEKEEIPTVSTYTYFENAHETTKPSDFSGSVLVENETSQEKPESNGNAVNRNGYTTEPFTFDDYEPQYNSDISTDSFITNPKKSVENIDENAAKNETKDNQKTIQFEDLLAEEPVSEEKTQEDEINDTFADSVVTESLTPSTDKTAAADSEDFNNNQKQNENVATQKEHVFEQMSIDTRETQAKPEVDPDEPDDFMSVDDIPDQREYKDILTKIFEINDRTVAEKKAAALAAEAAAEAEKAAREKEEDDEKIVNFPIANKQPEQEPDEKFDVLVDELDLSDLNAVKKQENYKDEKNEKVRGDSATKPNGGFDYSDIISYSEEEGFKVSTSDRTNKSELGKILVNKLNFHASLIFFVLIALETLIVGLTMNKVLKFPISGYVLFGFAIFIIPLICGIIYFISPKRAVTEIRSFKSSFETALIITLNALIAVLVLSVILDLDYSSYPDVARMILIPILAAINIPVFIIIRYSLLDRQKYYS